MIELAPVDNPSSILGDTHVIHSEATPNHTSKQTAFMSPATKSILAVSCIATIATFASMAFSSSATSQVDSMTTPNETGVHQNLHFDLKTLEPTKFHQSGFGALNFHHHDSADEKYRRMLSTTEVKIPVSAVEHAIPSLGEKNIINLAGHYNHDETRSPWSSLKYDRPKEELLQEQKEYLDKMHKVREEWGSWNFKDHADIVRPVQDLSSIEYKDIKNSDWEKNVWQTDNTYVTALIKEGRELVNRMTEGIYAELGFPTKKADGSLLSAEELAAREEELKVHINEDLNYKNYEKGLAYITPTAFDGLVRKLLHAMITNDEFYFVLGGHSAAAGHGNNFFQQKTMQFNHIMEPVFQKLGIRLISRNLAMGGYGTLHFSAGQAELYGEKDFLMWDSAMTEKSTHDTDLFNKQGFMNGERVPIIMTMYPNNMAQETGGKGWFGDFLPSYKYLPETQSIDQGRTLPWLTQFQNCADDVPLCGGRDMVDKYDGKCWVERSDLDIHPKATAPGGQASWHPGWRYHRIESRKAALIFMKAFSKAFDTWEEGIQTDGFPLAEKYWHVGDVYKDMRETFNTYINGEGFGTSPCEQRYSLLAMDHWCRHGMHGMSTFRPINLGQGNGILKNVMPSPSGYVPKDSFEDYYTGPDILPLSWKIPEGEVDVHAIAIATSYEAELNEHLFDESEEEEDLEDGRMLRSSVTEGEDAGLNVVESDRWLESSEVVPGGEGWGLEGGTGSSPTEYCDGSPQSECGRTTADPWYGCLLSGANDRRNTLSGDGLSGWLVMKIPGEVKHGVIWAKLEWWHPRINWPLSGSGRMLGSSEGTDTRRELGKAMEYPDDVMLDIAVNGKIYATWDKEKIMSNAYPELSYNEAIYRFITNDMSVSGKDVQFGLRIRSESQPKVAGLGVAHIYWS